MAHRVELVVDGVAKPLSDQETRVALNAVIAYRKAAMRDSSSRKQRDMKCWELHMKGHPCNEIAAMLGITIASAISAVNRVENGRYGDVLDGC